MSEGTEKGFCLLLCWVWLVAEAERNGGKWRNGKCLEKVDKERWAREKMVDAVFVGIGLSTFGIWRLFGWEGERVALGFGNGFLQPLLPAFNGLLLIYL